jgi:hypothetical protein
VTEAYRIRVCKALANLAAEYLFRSVHMHPALCTNRFALLSRSLGHHVRTLSFTLAEDSGQAFVHCIAQTLTNLPNTQGLTVACDAWKTVTNSAITNAIAKLQHLERVAFSGLGYGSIDRFYSPPSPTLFNTTFNQILSSRAEQLTFVYLNRCPFHCAPGTFQLLRQTAKNLQVLILKESLHPSFWRKSSQPVTWACADRLIRLEITQIYGTDVAILVEHIASGRLGNLKRLLVDRHWLDHDKHTAIPYIEWNIRPLDVLILSQVPKLELKIFGCLHAKEVHVKGVVDGVSEQTMIELVQGGGFEEMTTLRILQREWKYMGLEGLTSACADRNAELLCN